MPPQSSGCVFDPVKWLVNALVNYLATRLALAMDYFQSSLAGGTRNLRRSTAFAGHSSYDDVASAAQSRTADQVAPRLDHHPGQQGLQVLSMSI